MNRHTQFRTLFLHLATLGIGAAGCGGISSSEFQTNVCSGNILEGVTPSKPVDYLELRSDDYYSLDQPELYGGPSPSVLARVGTPCSGASDKAVCQTTLSKLFPPKLQSPKAIDHFDGRYLVYTRGDEVGAVATQAELGAFLAPFENAHDGALLLSEFTEHSLNCDGPNARPSASTFEYFTETGYACGAGTHRDAHVVRIESDGAVNVLSTELLETGSGNCAIGRRPEGYTPSRHSEQGIGAYLAIAAELEAASVPAFRRLARELQAHGAPQALIARAKKAAKDEVKHTRSMRKLAVRFGGVPRLPKVGTLATRSLVEIAIENAKEGCVRETFGALVATYQSHHASDLQVRAELQVIAQDETEHAALAWDVAEWIASRLTRDEQGAVEQALENSRSDLRADLASDGFAPKVLGLPSPSTALRLFEAMTESMLPRAA